MNLDWTTIKIAAVNNGFIIDVDGQISVATGGSLAKQIAAAIHPDDNMVTRDSDPAQLQMEGDQPRRSDERRPIEVTPAMVDTIRRKTNGSGFTVADLSEWFPESIGTYRRASSLARKGVDAGIFLVGQRTAKGVLHSIAADAPPEEEPVEPTEETAPKPDKIRMEMGDGSVATYTEVVDDSPDAAPEPEAASEEPEELLPEEPEEPPAAAPAADGDAPWDGPF